MAFVVIVLYCVVCLWCVAGEAKCLVTPRKVSEFFRRPRYQLNLLIENLPMQNLPIENLPIQVSTSML
jgi:hypothetical protein